MDISETEDYFRIPTSSSSFFALSKLDPPSPIPSSSASDSFNFSVVFEDLPIFLVDSVRPDSYLLNCNADLCLDYQWPMAPSDFATTDDGGGQVKATVSSARLDDDETFGSGSTGSLSSADRRDAFEATADTSAISDSETTQQEQHRTIGITRHARRESACFGGHSLWGRSDEVLPKALPDDLKVGLSESPPESDALHQPTSTSERTEPTFTLRSPPRPSKPLRPAKLEAANEYAWLRGMSIELLIDQEGFRSATPSLRYRSSSTSTTTGATSVTFKPTSRQPDFYFHYSPFDSLPILRRVTVQGEGQTKDYISKQAQLTMKANGVYSVHGVETTHLPVMEMVHLGAEAGHSTKLDWEFLYRVEDRLDAYGNVVDAEKKLVPLTFTCSPWLLNPTRGKKIGLVHMLKKGVATKLTAERSFASTTGSQGGHGPGGKGEKRSHSRAQSHVVAGRRACIMDDEAPPVPHVPGETTIILEHMEPRVSMRRRASFFGH